MRKVLAAGPTVKGLDVSHWDDKIDFSKVKASGRHYCFSKASEYTADKNFKTNRAGAKAAGMLFAGYHFFHPLKNPKTQAEMFLKIAEPSPGELPPILDWEVTDNVPSVGDRTAAMIWLDIVEKAIGRKPIIYGAPYFLEALQLDVRFKNYPLWIAHYVNGAPLVPKPWDTWTFHQHTDKGDVPGIPAPNEDLDLFNGSLDDLHKLTI
jgi:lysozyme